MTDPTLDAINAVRRDLGDLRVDLNGRLENVVTRREHDAVVSRLEAADEHQRAALAQHEAESDKRLDTIESAVAAGDRAILEAVERDKAARVAEAAREKERRSADRKWTIGAVFTAAGVAASVAGLVLR